MGTARPTSRSGFERAVMRDLDERGVNYEYEPQAFQIEVEVPRIKCQACGAAIIRKTRYTPDLRLPGEFHYIECKGKLTPNEQRRLKAFHVQHVLNHPNRRFRILFMRDNWLTKNKRKRYTEWATEAGIESAVGTRIPDGWITWERLK